MSKNTIYNLNYSTYNTIADEEYEDVGSSTFQLGTTKRAFVADSFSIVTDDSNEHELILDTDYELMEEDLYYSSIVGASVYTGVRVLTGGYQSGGLLISYKAIGSYTDADTLPSPDMASTSSVKTDAISELTLNNGVDIEGVHFEDGDIEADKINVDTIKDKSGAGVTISENYLNLISENSNTTRLIIRNSDTATGMTLGYNASEIASLYNYENTVMYIVNVEASDLVLGTDNTARLTITSTGDIESEGGDFIGNLTGETATLSAGLRLSGGVIATGGETSPDVDAGGLCLNQGAGDGSILTFKSSDVAHGISGAETDTYASFSKTTSTEGGLEITSFGENEVGMTIEGHAVNEDTGTGSLAAATVRIRAQVGTSQSAHSADGNILSIGSVLPLFFFKGDGDFRYDGAASAFDDENDIMLSRAMQYEMAGWDKKEIAKHSERLHELGIMENGFISRKKLDALTLGTFSQMFNIFKGLAKRLDIPESELFDMARQYN